MSWTTSHSGVN